MSVPPGFGGAPYVPGTPAKLRRMRNMVSAQERTIELEVDGGISFANLREVVEGRCRYDSWQEAVVYDDRASVAANVNTLRQALQ